MRFQERLQLAFARERARRRDQGHPPLTKTDLWKAAGLSSGAVSHWFSGGNDADLSSCIKIAPLLRCDPWWLYDESGPAPGATTFDPTPIKPSLVTPGESPKTALKLVKQTLRGNRHARVGQTQDSATTQLDREQAHGSVI